LLWAFAFLITLLMAYYQHNSEPTNPVSGKVKIGQEWVHYKLLQIHAGNEGALVAINTKDTLLQGFIDYKPYKSSDSFSRITMSRKDGLLQGLLPHLPPAGKLTYRVVLQKGKKSYNLNEGKAVVLRYQSLVPVVVLFPNIFFMFISLLFAMRAALGALTSEGDHVTYLSGVVLFSLFLGGLILGPLVQKYAFGTSWGEWYFGHDMTPYKTLLMFGFWLVAWLKLRKDSMHKFWILVAALVMIGVYVIPHYTWGPEIASTQTQQKQIHQLK